LICCFFLDFVCLFGFGLWGWITSRSGGSQCQLDLFGQI
jgi:hypothetical protein